MDKSSAGGGDSRSRDLDLRCGSTPEIILNISTTTGGNFQINVRDFQTIDNLKKLISKKLKVSKDRICLLHRERELQEGSLKENGLIDGSKIILIPNVETGLLAQRPENTVMQALESLNDSQVNDFLSGKTPLNLSMRLGDHMMLIQLQLSTVNPSAAPSGSTSSSNKSRNHQQRTRTSSNSTTTATTVVSQQFDSFHSKHRKLDINNEQQNFTEENLSHLSPTSTATNLDFSSGTSSSTGSLKNQTAAADINTFLCKQDFDNLNNIVKTFSQSKQFQPSTSSAYKRSLSSTDNVNDYSSESTSDSLFNTTSTTDDSLLEQSPIKSLSNLVSSPIKTTSIKNIHNSFDSSNNSSYSFDDCTDPISAKLTSCLCKQYSTSNFINSSNNSNNSNKNCETVNCQIRNTNNTNPDHVRNVTELQQNIIPKGASSPTNKTSSNSSSTTSILHKTCNSPIGKTKHRNQSNGSGGFFRKTVSLNNLDDTAYKNNVQATSSSTSNSSGTINNNYSTINLRNSPNKSTFDDDISDSLNGAITMPTDNRTLAEASRNLTQTLRKLSKEVFTNKLDPDCESTRNKNSGAVIESMKNHGKGIYSGTFSGTLNPALQDRFGRPKRDISTVIHILNDLLSATPQYSRGARICFETPNQRNNNKQIITKHKSTSTGTETTCLKCSSISCVYGECSGHSSSTAQSKSCHTKMKQTEFSTETGNAIYNASSNLMDKNLQCTCGHRSNLNADNSDIKICNTCSIEIENNKTKSKLDQLRLVMQQRKQRREERKLKGSPYGGALVASNNSNSNGNETVVSTTPIATASPTEQGAHIEEVDTAA